jgi:hypothetical protein
VKKIFSILFALVLLVSLGLVTTVPVLASTTIHVPGDYPNIQAALNASEDGDTIMVAAGEYDAFLVQGKSDISIIGAEGATITTAEVFSIDVGPIGAAWAMGAVKDSDNISIEGINFDGTEVGIGDWVVGIAYVDSTGGIADVTLENILGTELAAGVAILGYEGTSVVDLSGVTVENSVAGVIIWDAEANLGGCTITGNLLAGILVGIPEEWWGPSIVNIQGSTISNHEEGVGIWVCDDSTPEIHFNNIAGNSFGLWNDGSETVDAAYNWWGDASGPYHGTLNPDGMGDEVSDDVDFEPWLESASVTQTVTNTEVDAIDEADTIVEVHGTATVTISKYAGNPYPEAPIEGEGELASLNVGTLQTDQVTLEDSFIDVLVTRREVGTYMVIKIYYTEEQIEDFDEGTLRACWTNEVDPEYYLKCSHSGVVTYTQTVDGNEYSGYISATIDNYSSPSMNQLDGTIFGGYGSGGTVPQNGCGGCFIATAAYGTDTAGQLDVLRAFRDTILLRSSLGTKLVSFYCRTSPPIANFIARHEVLRTVVRVGFIDPLVRALSWTHDLWLG